MRPIATPDAPRRYSAFGGPMHLKLRLIYAMHMILPLRLAYWHIERLDAETVRALTRLFPS